VRRTTVVGIDCATVNRNTGLAFASVSGGVLSVEDCFVARPGRPVADQVSDRLPVGRNHRGDIATSALLALDAPLGWPAALGTGLSNHQAGRPMPASSNTLFRRCTDEVIRGKLRKAPLEVGANFIARTAVSALKLLADLSELQQTDVLLAWDPDRRGRLSAIEVYPAGTLRAYQAMGYVQQGGSTENRKRRLVASLERSGRLRFRPHAVQEVRNEHVLDAVLCCLAALDFLEGKTIAPAADHVEKARKEGWIWVRDPIHPKQGHE